MPAKVRYGIVAICDNVYKDDSSNKIVIAGLFSGDIITSGAAPDLRLALYVEIFFDDLNFHDVDMQFWFGGKHVSAGKSRMQTGETRLPAAMLVPAFGIAVSLPGVFQLKIAVDGGKASKVLERRIILDPSYSTAAPPHS